MIAEFRADPGRPNELVRGRRLSDQLRRMHETGRLSDSEWWAVERFRDDWSLVTASGLSAAPMQPRQGGGGGRNWLPGDAILSALRRLRLAQAAMAPNLRIVAVLSIIEGYPLAEAARLARRAKQRTATDLRAALALLVDCYGRDSRPAPSIAATLV